MIYAPSHESKYYTAWLASEGIEDEKIMTWPPSSADLNTFEKLWALLKNRRYTVKVKQYTSLNSLWEAVVAAAQRFVRQLLKQQSAGMEGF